MRIIWGKTEAFFETGLEGIMWAVFDKRNKGYESLHKVEDGDFLIVWEGKETAFAGEINLLDYPRNRFGVQDGLDYKAWFKLFRDELECCLIKDV